MKYDGDVLVNAADYLGRSTYSKSGNGLTYVQWFEAYRDAINILNNPAKFARKPKAAKLSKSVIAVVDTPYETVVVVDFDQLERDVLRGSIADGDVQKLLPFQTQLGQGENHFHLINASAYIIETKSHFIREGETLCKRGGYTPRVLYSNPDHATCPGCLAKAKTVIVNHLLGPNDITRY